MEVVSHSCLKIARSSRAGPSIWALSTQSWAAARDSASCFVIAFCDVVGATGARENTVIPVKDVYTPWVPTRALVCCRRWVKRDAVDVLSVHWGDIFHSSRVDG